MTAPGHRLKGQKRKNDALPQSEKEEDDDDDDDIVLDPDVLSKVVIPVRTVFVKETTRKSPHLQCPLIKTTRQLYPPLLSDGASIKTRPPLLASPVAQRRLNKDISPSIRHMHMKYNQMISEKGVGGGQSANSSGSTSPWRSPVSERRFIAQRERYLDALNNLSPQSSPREVRKSASVNILRVPAQGGTANEADGVLGILRSTSDGYIRNKSPPKRRAILEETPKLNIDPVVQQALEERSRKLHR